MPPEKLASISKNELETILEVNKSAIVLQTQVASQYEEIIDKLDDNKKVSENYKTDQSKIKDDLNELKKNSESNNRTQDKIKDDTTEIKKMSQETKDGVFKLNILMASGIISLILNIIQLLINLKK
jgi:hypothetical protein